MTKDPLHQFDQEPNLCPDHGLSLNSDYTCIVCRLALEGKELPSYSRHQPLETGITPEQEAAQFYGAKKNNKNASKKNREAKKNKP